MSSEAVESPQRARMRTIFGWVAGGCMGLLLNYPLYLAFGEKYPKEPTTFVLFVAGAMLGMRVSDRMGPSGFRPLGVAAGVSLTGILVLLILIVMSSGTH